MNLTAIDGGIVRLRTKGGANPRTLYDLLNGYVTASRTIKVRPGTYRMATLPASTKGLTAFSGALHVFSSAVETVPAGYVNHVLTHPDFTEDTLTPEDFELAEIHFAEPFLGFLYVVAEFGNGDIFHYWLQSNGAWTANKIYRHGDIVEPTVPNGLAYTPLRIGSALPSWAPSAPRTVGDQIEPTTYNDYYYTVVETFGASPASGLIEPDWPTTPGAHIIEDTDGASDEATTTAPDSQTPSGDVTDRYDF